MAQSKSALKENQSDTAQLSHQIETLKSDIASISQTLVDMGAARSEAVANDASRKVAHIRKQGEQTLQDAQAKVEDLTHQATDAVRQQPAAAVGLAVGVGFALGYLTGRK